MNRVDVTIQDIFRCLKRYYVWIVLSVVAFTAVAFVYTQFFVTPMYRTTIIMGVNSNGRGSSEEVTSSQLAADASIAETYKVLLTSQPVMRAVSEQLNGELTEAQLKARIEARTQKNTMVLLVSVVDSNPNRAATIANTLADIGPKVLGTLPVGGTLYGIETAKVPSKQYTPDLTSNLVLGALLGLLISSAVIVLIALLDTTIWREEDLERAFHIPVLGSVPSMKPNSMAKIQKRKFRR